MKKPRNNKYAKYMGVEGRFWKIEEDLYTLQTDKNQTLSTGFKIYIEPELKDKMYIDIDKNSIESAYEVSTYCNWEKGLYYLENIWNSIVILSPEFETKQKLGLHIYDDKRIEIEYNNFIEGVEEIWEERTPIKGFKFDVEPIYYIKKNGKYLE